MNAVEILVKVYLTRKKGSAKKSIIGLPEGLEEDGKRNREKTEHLDRQRY